MPRQDQDQDPFDFDTNTVVNPRDYTKVVALRRHRQREAALAAEEASRLAALEALAKDQEDED
jgi:hypothetical protein